MKVLVTGANGFVGAAVCRRLLREGWEVAGAVRRDVDLLGGVEARLVAPLSPQTRWAEALEGIEAVVHLAGRVHVMRDRAQDPLAAFRAANAAATLHLAREAERAGVAHFLFMSSIKVNGDATAAAPFGEADPPAPADPYGVSKWEAEQGLAGLGPMTMMRITILRPPLVYGPFVGGNFLALMKALAAGWPLPLGAIRNKRSLIFVGNLADAVAAALREPAGICETYLMSDGEDVATPDLIRRLARAMGCEARLLSVPPSCLDRAAALFGRRAAVRRLVGSLQVDSAAFRKRFAWTPPFTLDQGLAETAQWFMKARQP